MWGWCVGVGMVCRGVGMVCRGVVGGQMCGDVCRCGDGV